MSQEVVVLRVLAALMRLYSYLFHGVLSLLMVVIALVSWFSGSHSLDLLLVPWRDEPLRWTLLVGGLAGLTIVWLATRDRAPVLFLGWSGLVFLALLRGFFFGWVHYVRGPYPLSWALL
ncbi:MAG: hypothetical protein ACPL88_10960, partial [Bryobacteraceae bacterium]